MKYITSNHPSRWVAKHSEIIRVQDFVKIDNPLMFVRCGYPKCLESETAVVLKEYGDKIDVLLEATTVVSGVNPLVPGMTRTISLRGDDRWENEREKIAKTIAYSRLKLHGFGGRERTIYTKEMPELAGCIVMVDSIKYVKTGKYYPPCDGENYEGEYDWESGGLENEKTHKILSIRFSCYCPDPRPLRLKLEDNPLAIEDCNVIKVQSDNGRGKMETK